jgi:hypothetical protein
MMGPNFRDLLPVLARGGVRFIVIGGGAAIAHGSSRATYDVDVVYARDAENVRRLAAALPPYHPYLRGAPPGLLSLGRTDDRCGAEFHAYHGIGRYRSLGRSDGRRLASNSYRSQRNWKCLKAVVASFRWKSLSN